MTESHPLHVAVVLAADGPRLLTAAPTRAALLESVAGYVAAHAPDRLWPDDASRVAEHLRDGDHEGAIRHYFETGDRPWDEEQLHVHELDAAEPVIDPSVPPVARWHAPRPLTHRGNG
jgi:hypothetical protein